MLGLGSTLAPGFPSLFLSGVSVHDLPGFPPTSVGGFAKTDQLPLGVNMCVVSCDGFASQPGCIPFSHLVFWE